GSDQIIADEQVFRSSDIGRLTNATRPSLFGFFSCTVGQFDALGQEGLGELLLKTPAGGAAASIAATEVGFGFESTQLNDDIVDRLFPLRPRFDRTQTGLGPNGSRQTVHYFVPGPILFRGDVPLSSGAFEARFVVPVDARVAGGTGQLRALLSAAGGRGVGLAVDSLRIGQGISSRTDLDPPVITLLHPAGADSTFQSGDRLTFVIQDSSGV